MSGLRNWVVGKQQKKRKHLSDRKQDKEGKRGGKKTKALKKALQVQQEHTLVAHRGGGREKKTPGFFGSTK